MNLLLRISLLILACDLVRRSLSCSSAGALVAYLAAAAALIGLAWGRA